MKKREGRERGRERKRGKEILLWMQHGHCPILSITPYPHHQHHHPTPKATGSLQAFLFISITALRPTAQSELEDLVVCVCSKRNANCWSVPHSWEEAVITELLHGCMSHAGESRPKGSSFPITDASPSHIQGEPDCTASHPAPQLSVLFSDT